jgi:class 3 adenylate cyclase
VTKPTRTLRADTTIGFAVRMGLHTGETVEWDGRYSGSEVNRAARLTALAHGEQVLVSDAADVLLRNRLSVRPLGEHVLRGLRAGSRCTRSSPTISGPSSRYSAAPSSS